jgi:hypothetical protein
MSSTTYKIIVEQHEDGFVAYPLGFAGCVVGQGDTAAEAIADVQSAIRYLPGRDQKDAIWGIYTRHYGLDAKQARPDNSNWTGAEIKSCCRLASLSDVPLVQQRAPCGPQPRPNPR